VLSQEAADHLAQVAKQITSARVIVIPASGKRMEWQASADQEKHRFYLNMRRGLKVPTQLTLQERYETNEILLRLDIDGPPHGNPDGTVVPTPHLHIYREGYDAKWAFPVPPDLDISSVDPLQVLVNFLLYCGITPIPPVQGGMLP
jgi:hypothetical protein